MRFGLFGSAQVGPNGSGGAQGFHDWVDFNLEAEALGYVSTFLVEHHFTGWGQASATLGLLTWLAARTRRLRLGTATLVLPWHNPVLLAEQAATLDLLSGGRLDLGVGKGYRHSEFRGFGVPAEEAEARFDETLEVMLRAFGSTERFTHRGRFWRFEDVVVEPMPAQRPHPPLWMAAGSEASVARVARRGFNLLLDQFAGPELIGRRIAAYRAGLEASGHRFDPMRVAVARDLQLVERDSERGQASARIRASRQRIVDVALAPGQQHGSHILAYAQAGEAPSTENALIGTPGVVAAELARLRDAGVAYVILSINGGSRETLRRFAAEVMPGLAGPH